MTTRDWSLGRRSGLRFAEPNRSVSPAVAPIGDEPRHHGEPVLGSPVGQRGHDGAAAAHSREHEQATEARLHDARASGGGRITRSRRLPSRQAGRARDAVHFRSPVNVASRQRKSKPRRPHRQKKDLLPLPSQCATYLVSLGQADDHRVRSMECGDGELCPRSIGRPSPRTGAVDRFRGTGSHVPPTQNAGILGHFEDSSTSQLPGTLRLRRGRKILLSSLLLDTCDAARGPAHAMRSLKAPPGDGVHKGDTESPRAGHGRSSHTFLVRQFALRTRMWTPTLTAPMSVASPRSEPNPDQKL